MLFCMYYQDVLFDTQNNNVINIQCGRASNNCRLNMIGDDTGDNISADNRYWSEITGLYWIYKNFEYKRLKYIGTSSYRRFLNLNRETCPLKIVRPDEAAKSFKKINDDVISEILIGYDVILPVQYTYAWSIRRVFSMNYSDSDFELLEEAVKLSGHEYYGALETICYQGNRLEGHNLFIMKPELFEIYSEWVFDILMTLRSQINPKDYSISEVRVFGYMHELLLPIFCKAKNLKVYRSQISWVDKEAEKSRFNGIIYRSVCNFVFKSMSFLGRHYPHLKKK